MHSFLHKAAFFKIKCKTNKTKKLDSFAKEEQSLFTIY